MRDQPAKPPQPLDYASLVREKRRWPFRLACTLLSVVGALMLVTMIRPLLYQPRIDTFRMSSASNLRQIGMAILLYSNEFKGRYPDTFRDLVLTEDTGSEMFACPTAGDTPAQGSTPQAIAANLLAGGHCSYLYVGKGLTQKMATPDMVIAYEPVSVNGGEGMNVLFGDGHVEFLSAKLAVEILNQVKEGKWPVRFPRVGSSTSRLVRTP